MRAFAIENAVEGVVRETYGAASFVLSARRAQGKKLRAALSAVAEDECRHASLSIDVDAWASTLLDEAAKKQRRLATANAVRELYASIEADRSPAELLRVLGLPSITEGTRLARSLEASLWIRSEPGAPRRRRSDFT